MSVFLIKVTKKLSSKNSRYKYNSLLRKGSSKEEDAYSRNVIKLCYFMSKIAAHS